MAIELETIYSSAANGCNSLADNLNAWLLDTTTPLLYPGTGEDLELLTGINAPVSGGPTQDVKPANFNDVLTILIRSPGGTYDWQPLVFIGHPFTTGSPPPLH